MFKTTEMDSREHAIKGKVVSKRNVSRKGGAALTDQAHASRKRLEPSARNSDACVESHNPDVALTLKHFNRRADKSAPRLDYERLMFEPGDGLVTRTSQTARRPLGLEAGGEGFNMLPVRQSFFLCESHGRLTHNLYFQDNLLYFLLSR